MTAGIIDRCGAFGGKVQGPTVYNAKGQFENTAIRDGVIKPFLRRMKCDPKGQKPLPDLSKVRIVEAAAEWLRTQVYNVMRDHGYEYGPWYYKGAKMCLLWPFWAKAFPKAKWILVRRRKEDIISSCLKTYFMDAYRTADGWAGWVDHHEKCFEDMKAAGLWVREIWPSEMVNGDFSAMEKVVSEIGLTWNSEAPAFVSPKLWHYTGGSNGR
jgi:hypothetical protein